ncbi:unnamed protein product [Haemonchus placei]|uniref:Membrane-associated kinase regulator 6 n=1 Tax=Haemonchus placei TaxID=6290 RepID=A0A0N4WTW7_HAEPC|nr:unnamed protein product [Haemonchus placei]
MAMFDDILSRAESLSSSKYHSKINNFLSSKKNSRFSDISPQDNPYSGTTFDKDLNSIFRASEHLWKTNSGSVPMKKSFLFGEKGVVFGTSVPALKESQLVPQSSDELEIDVDRERVRLETERCFFNHVLLSRPKPPITSSIKLTSKVNVYSCTSRTERDFSWTTFSKFVDTVFKVEKKAKSRFYSLLDYQLGSALTRASQRRTHRAGASFSIGAPTFNKSGLGGSGL